MNIHDIPDNERDILLRFATAKWTNWHWEQAPDDPTRLRYRSADPTIEVEWFYMDHTHITRDYRVELERFRRTGRPR